MKTIRILLVDDHEVVRAGLRALLGVAAYIQVVGEERTAAGAVAAAARLKPDVVVLDLRLPDANGLTACQQIKRRQPDTRVLVLTSVADDQTIVSVIQAGADGYVLKDVVGVDMVATVEKIAAGESLLDPITTRRVMARLRATAPVSPAGPLQRLTAQELRVLAEVAQGRSDKEVAEVLNLSAKTVRNYLDNIFAKLDVHSRTQVAVLYEQLRGRGGGRSS